MPNGRKRLLGAFLFLLMVFPTLVGLSKTITLDGRQTGRTFEGIGGLSGGASSRLLIDYPEPQRSQVLDLLFRPNFGAALHELKIEIGGDVNSTDGVEPSFARTREEFAHPRPEFFQRGYEWWLMREAKKRNLHIKLHVLPCGAPDWIGDGDYPDVGDPNSLKWEDRVFRNRKKFYTQDGADYLAAFCVGTQKYHGLPIDYCALWNETLYDVPWIKLLRKTLNGQGLGRVGIVAADQDKNIWSIVDAMERDAELKTAVCAVGVHYPGMAGGPLHDGAPVSSPAARQCGKPLWASEDGPWRGDWTGACVLAKMVNRNYVIGKMTKIIVWSLTTAYYDTLPLPNSGPITANSPWSGHYEVLPALWALAHTTQFAQPGWKYLDGGCGLLKDGGSYVCLRSPNADGHYSLIIETVDAKLPQWVSFRVCGGLATGPLHVWSSSQRSQFDQRADLFLDHDSFTVALEPGSIYSLTTTTGQCKGKTKPPPPAGFPLPYHDDFESVSPGKMPRYFADQGGIFEIAPRTDGGNCLRQMLVQRGIDWHYHPTPEPYTMIGSSEWRDYEVSCDALVEKSGYVSLFGRIESSPQSVEPPKGYCLTVDVDGRWELKAFTKVLASGTVPVTTDRWHKLGVKFVGSTITAIIDGVPVHALDDGSFRGGMAGVGSGWNHAMFDDFKVRRIEPGTQPESIPGTTNRRDKKVGDKKDKKVTVTKSRKNAQFRQLNLLPRPPAGAKGGFET